jgi:hypothetical protein
VGIASSTARSGFPTASKTIARIDVARATVASLRSAAPG